MRTLELDETDEQTPKRALRVLLVEDDPDVVMITELHLRAGGHEVVSAPSMHDGITALEKPDADFDVLLLDLGLPDIDGLEGLRVASELCDVPIVVMTGDGRGSTRTEAAELGAVEVLVKGEADADHLARALVLAAERQRGVQQAPLGVTGYDDRAVGVKATLEVLAAVTPHAHWGFVHEVGTNDVLLAASGALELAPGALITWSAEVTEHLGTDAGIVSIDHEVDLFTADDRPVRAVHASLVALTDGRARCGVLVGWSDAPVELDTAHRAVLVHEGRQLATVLAQEQELTRAERRAGLAGSAAAVDALTSLGNRRAYDSFVRAEESRSSRLGHPSAVFVVDLDGLKAINDRQGHGAGDRYLRAAAEALTATVRLGDEVFRIGGDEFALVAPGCDMASAPLVAARLRAHLEERDVQASIGWAARPPESTLGQAANAADEQMYEDKQRRRDAGSDATATDEGTLTS